MSKVTQLTRKDDDDLDLTHLYKKEPAPSKKKPGPKKKRAVTKKKVTAKSDDKPKKKRGRPLIWTEEKIAQMKAEKKAKRDKDREEELDNVRFGKLDINQAFNLVDQKRVVDKIVQTKKQTDEHITQKRQHLKQAEQQYNRTPDCSHLYKFSHAEGLTTVVTCKHCSQIDKMAFGTYVQYVRDHREEL